MICVPDVRNQQAFNPLQPKVQHSVLSAVEEFLGEDAPPFVALHARNPVYEALAVQAQILFRPEVDASLALPGLAHAIAAFLSPWAFDPGVDLAFGGEVHRSALLDLLERQEAVEAVLNFRLLFQADGDSLREVEVAKASYGASVLVPAETHDLQAIRPEDLDCEGSPTYGGIGFWVVEEDFCVEQ